jgi:uncharacterized caspase-like protein
MTERFSRVFLVWALVMMALLLGQRPGHAETRFALVVGNDEYKSGKLATPANDAGLIADTLQSAGFTVTGARNLDQATLREAFREFLGQVSAAGPEAVAFVYLAGYGLQYEGDNYYVPVDAELKRDADIALQAIRISDFTQALTALPVRANIVIVDAARQNPFASGDQRLANGLALVDPAPNMAIAFNAAPGTVGPEERGPYGAYATALAEMISAGGLGLDDLFARIRLRVSDLTQGAEVPWYASGISSPFYFTERAADAPPAPNVMPLADVRGKSMRDFSRVEDAYEAALEIDTIDGYRQFLAAYPDGPLSRRIAAMLAIRREEIIWRRCVLANTPRAYWSYLRRYPHGPHVTEAHLQLLRLAAAMEPPPDLEFIDFGVPPPPPSELAFVDRPIVVFAGDGFDPPPPPPLFFLPPRPREFAALPPPPPSHERYGLPAPAAVVIPAFVQPPPGVTLHRPPPLPGAPPNGRPEFRVSLPSAVQSPESPASPATPSPGPPISPPPHMRSSIPAAPPSAPPPSPALVKPGPPTHHPGPPGPALVTIKPSPPPSPPSGPTAAVAKPSPPPPHPRGPSSAVVTPGPTPAHPLAPVQTAIKPGPPPPLPPSGPAPLKTIVKPAPTPQPPPASAVTVKGSSPHPAGSPPTPKPPPCPPGKTLANVNGRDICK